jgi:hypothetical protein
MFVNVGTAEFTIILLIALALIVGIGNYGRNTALGYWGSVLLAIFSTPLVAFAVIFFLKSRKQTNS